jgi:hypothetical protein
MQIKKKLNKLIRLYIIFFSSILFINIIFTSSLTANTFKIKDLEVSEPFELNFDKEKVIDKGFQKAFLELVSMITTSGDKKKIRKTHLKTIKGLIDSFTMNNESFVNNEYNANFDVNFNKKNTLNFFEKKNIFISIPKKKKLLLIPILIDLQADQILLFNNNIFYEKWNEKNERYFLLNYLIPNEDIEDINLIKLNNESIEDYDFIDIIKKYDLSDFIIAIIYKNDDQIRVLSKIKLKNSFKIDNQKFENIDLLKNSDLEMILNDLKITYENHWKNINKINTSIKLSLNVLINANEHAKIKIFENTLTNLDLVSSFEISKFDNKNVYFKVIYNGSPNKFINDINETEMVIDTKNQIWEIQ